MPPGCRRAVVLAALAASPARGVLLDEEASTAQRTFEGSVAQRAAKPLTTIEDVPEWVRLTFADKYMAMAAPRSKHASAAEEDDEDWGNEEFLDQGGEEDEEQDIFDAHLPRPKDHQEAFADLEEHEHAAQAPRRHGRRRMHHRDDERRVTHSALEHHHIVAADKRHAPRRTEDWGGGGVDTMMSMLEQHSLVEAHAHTETLGASRRARRAAAARPLPSLQGRVPTPSRQRRPEPPPQPVFLQAAMGAAGQQSAPLGGAGGWGGWQGAGRPLSPQEEYAQRSTIAAQASQRALRQLGLLEEAPMPGSGGAGAGAGGGYAFGPGIAGSFLQQGSSVPPQRSLEHWQESYVDGVLADLGLGAPWGGGLGPGGRASGQSWRAGVAGSFYDRQADWERWERQAAQQGGAPR